MSKMEPGSVRQTLRSFQKEIREVVKKVEKPRFYKLLGFSYTHLFPLKSQSAFAQCIILFL